jgi:hypothetical protein
MARFTIVATPISSYLFFFNLYSWRNIVSCLPHSDKNYYRSSVFMSSENSFEALPELPTEMWVPELRDFDMPEWSNVEGTLSGRIRKMNLDDVIEEYVSEDDIVVEVGSSKGYTSVEIANITDAQVLGADVPEAFSRGTANNRYGKGPEPDYVSGIAPFLPIKDESVDGIVALNSVSYLCRNIGSLATDYEEGASEQQLEKLEELHSQSMAKNLLDDFDRITGESGYVILGEQTDSSYLVLEKDDKEWKTTDYGSFPEHDGESLHTRYRSWILDENVEHI